MARDVILLFYDGYERRAVSAEPGKTLALAQRHLRAIYRGFKGQQINTGFYTAFLSLVDALESIGCCVRVNDFEMAARHPEQPIGVAGYPSVLGKVSNLSNPVLFGPGDPGFPDEAGRYLAKRKISLLIQPSEWFVEYYAHFAEADRVVRWPAGIDTSILPDAGRALKNIDMLIYDKVRWHREDVVPRIVEPLRAMLDRRGLSHTTIRYGGHKRTDYIELLRRARSMAFICEHETQGLACEEALGMNVPVFAWDEGVLVDPQQRRFDVPGLRVSSVPYFDDRCGVRFTLRTLEESLEQFWERLSLFRPRLFVDEQLSMEGSARAYLALLERAAQLDT